MKKAILLSVVLCASAARAAETPVTWDMKVLGATPQVWESGYPERDGVRSLFFEGVPYEGQATRVFAYLAVPKVRPGEKVPGMVLVHGGGGSAFRRWAKFWCERGYAAISMDTCGAVSGNEFGDEQSNHRRHEWAGPKGWEDFANAVRKDPRDNWAYHAVAAVIRANSLLRSLPEVDAGRIGLTGVSWGGYLTCMAASVDGRFAFAAPVYGCGYLDDNSAWRDSCGKGRYTKEEFAKWCVLFDPRHYLANAACDFLWIDGSNDFAYPLDSLQKSVETLKTAWYRATRVRMPHGHWACAEHPQELVDFADFKLGGPGGRRDYPFVKSCGENRWGVVTAEWEAGADEIVRAELNWTADRGAWQKREWKSVPMKLRAPRFTAEAELPDGAVCWYVNGFTADGKCVSGELVMCADEKAPPSAARALTVEPGGLTMDGALERIRAARANGERGVVQVAVKGVNRVTKPVVLTAADHDIAFVGEDGAAVSGGIVLKDWTDVGGGVWEADAPKTPSGETMFVDQLWVGGRRASCARLPSEGWLRISSASQTVAEAGAPAKFVEHVVLDDSRAKKLAEVPLADYPDLEVGVICKWSYGLRTLGAYDAKANAIRLRTDFPWKSWKVWDRDGTLVAFFNVRSAFDAPGEWFLDRRAGKVRYRPLPGEDLAKAEIVVPHPAVTNLISLCGDWRADRRVKNVSFRNLSFGDAAAPTKANGPAQLDQLQAASGLDGMIRLEGTVNVTFDGCRVGRCAGYAFRCHSGTVRTHIVNCRVTDSGAGGVWMGADNPKGPDITRTVLEPNRPDAVAWNVVSNCVISGGGRYDPEGVGVCLSHCSDTAVVHNDIFDFYYSGVSVGWTWGYRGSVSQRNDIGFNRIWDLGKGVMSDMGGVYALGTSFGTRVHDNVIHDVKSFSYGGWGLYTDEGSEGIVEENNLVWNTTDAGFHQHFGVGCVVRNNIFAYNRMNGAVRTERAVVFGVPSSLHVVNNIIYVGEGTLAGDHVRNVGGVWANNLWYDLRGKDAARLGGLGWDGWTASGKETGGVFADPLFVDPEHFDFTLKPDSPALKLGFRPFDPSRAGAGARPRAAATACAAGGSFAGTVAWTFPRTGTCHEGLPFSDGVTGVLVWGGGDTINLTVGRADLWDHRGGYPWTVEQNYTNIVAAVRDGAADRLESLFRKVTPKGEPRNPYMLPLGRVVVKLQGGAALEHGELDPFTGLGKLSLSDGKVIELAMSKKSHVFAMKFPDGVSYAAKSVPATDHPVYERELKPVGFRKAEVFDDDGSQLGIGGFVWKLPADEPVALGWTAKGGELCLETSRGHEFRRRKCVPRHDDVAAESVAQWKDFWEKGARIKVPDPVVQRIFDYGMYRFGAMTDPDGVPAGLQGPWLEDDRLVPWNGDYHFNINVQECYSPAFRGGHFEHLMPLFKMVLSWRERLRENAKKFVGIDDGYVLPHSVDDRGVCIGGFWTGTIDHASTAWVAAMMMKYVRYSGDIEFLKSDAYDFMKGAMRVYRAMMEEKDGRFSIPLAPSPEWAGAEFGSSVGRDPSFQLAACHRLARDLVAAAEMLGEKPDPMWLDIEKRLPAYTVVNGHVGLFEGQDLAESHRHHSHLAGFYPFDTIDLGTEENRKLAERTFGHWLWVGPSCWTGWCVPWASILNVHAGNVALAVEQLHAWDAYFCDDGHGSHHNAVNPGFSSWLGGLSVMQMDGQCAAVTAAMELLVHEVNGKVEFFRGCPAGWDDVSFENIRLSDGTSVSGRRLHGKVTIRSGRTCGRARESK